MSTSTLPHDADVWRPEYSLPVPAGTTTSLGATVAARIVEQLHAAEMTISEAAVAAGYPVDDLAMGLADPTTLTVDHVAKVADVLGLDAGAFVAGVVTR